jgi:glycine cleavage system H lipoate-binding protein
VDGISLPGWLFYATNHMWLDLGTDGSCHIGIDGLLARVLSSVERITYITPRGVHRPSAVLTVRGVDFHMVFPNAMLITGTNVYLRANPASLTSDPYRTGWLFEGKVAPEGPRPEAGLVPGTEAAAQWMESETTRLNEFVHGLASRNQEALMADGGAISHDLLEHLDREQTLELFHSFFSPFLTSTR